jgi:CRP/FNR family cyclic AMP-dependent transcriptional regulator
MTPRNSLPVDKRKAPIAAREKLPSVNWETFLTGISRGRAVLEYGVNRHIFLQGQPADSVFFLLRGRVKLSVTSSEGKEAIVATLGSGEFFGEGCLAGQPLRMATASAITDSILDRLDKQCMARMLHEHHDVSEFFLSHLLERNSHYEQDLVHQFFNSIEKRLAGTLLKMADFDKKGRSETVVPSINQEDLAKMVGTTRSRVSQFMNKFKMLGFVDDDGEINMTVDNSLLTILLHD